MPPAGVPGQEPARDTVLVMVAPSGIANVSEWGLLALVVLAAVGAVALLVFLWRLDVHGRRLTAIARRMENRSRPVLERAVVVVDNVDAITRSLRDETRHLTGSVRTLSDRLRQASTHMETRIDEFNALLEVVQAEAEETFLTTAAAIRGVGAGARAFENRREAQPSALPPDGEEPADAADGEPRPPLGAPGPDDGPEPPAEERVADDKDR